MVHRHGINNDIRLYPQVPEVLKVIMDYTFTHGVALTTPEATEAWQDFFPFKTGLLDFDQFSVLLLTSLKTAVKKVLTVAIASWASADSKDLNFPQYWYHEVTPLQPSSLAISSLMVSRFFLSGHSYSNEVCLSSHHGYLPPNSITASLGKRS
jgi:hypothetical protein